MSPSSLFDKMDQDESRRDHENITEEWVEKVIKYSSASGVEKLASRYRENMPCKCVQKNNGSFNLCYKVLFEDDVAWAVHFPIPGRVMYPEEKIRREVAVLKFLGERTRIPVPTVMAFGAEADEKSGIGPFLIMEWVDGVTLTSVMEQLPRPSWGPVLREDIDDDTLYGIYAQMAKILLELSLHNFDQIGAPSMVTHGSQTSWSITSKPMTLKMNEIKGGRLYRC